MNEDFAVEVDEGPLQDTTDRDALDAVRDFFDQRRDRVFFSRQITVHHEKTWFHWITNRALGALIEGGRLGTSAENSPRAAKSISCGTAATGTTGVRRPR